jgi:hypothetical protein
VKELTDLTLTRTAQKLSSPICTHTKTLNRRSMRVRRERIKTANVETLTEETNRIEKEEEILPFVSSTKKNGHINDRRTCCDMKVGKNGKRVA